MTTLRRISFNRGFSIVEALIAMGLVVLALIGLFGVMPYTYRTMQDDSLRIEASTVAQRYLDDVRYAVQTGQPVPAPVRVPIDLGNSITTGQSNDVAASVDLGATCTRPDGDATSLFDCTITIGLSADGEYRVLTPIESYIVRQLP